MLIILKCLFKKGFFMINLKLEKGTEVSPFLQSLDVKTPLDESSSFSFANLLQNIVTTKENEKKEMPFFIDGKIVSSKKEDKKLLDIVSDKQDKLQEQIDPKATLEDLLHLDFQKITQTKTTPSKNEIKGLIYQAKRYLTSQIKQKNPDIKSEELPKTLKGLATFAKKLDINLSKITLQEVVVKPIKDTPKHIAKTALFFSSKNNSVINQEKKEHHSINHLGSILQNKKETISSHHQAMQSNTIETKKEKIEQKEVIKEDTIPRKIQNVQQKEVMQQDAVVSDKKYKKVQEMKQKEVVKEETTIHTKQETITVLKQVHPKEIWQKTVVQEREKTKHHKEKDAQKISSMTTTKSIQQTKQQENPLASLLQSQQTTSATKIEEKKVSTQQTIPLQTETKEQKSSFVLEENTKEEITIKHHIQTPKVENFEAKVHEAKQMVKYLSHDVKSAIEDYKAPFTKMKLQLNPQKLGELDITIIQRGKNLHINLHSNNSAIQTLSANVNDLKMQLNNNGINNATFHFSNTQNDSATSQQQQQQHHHQQREQAKQEYEYFQKEEVDEEVINSLEIIVPNYV